MEEAHQPKSAVTIIRRGLFARFWWAAVIGSTGDWITIFATLAVADEIAGGGGILVSLVSRIFPGLVFGPIIGALTDRWDRRRLIVIADLGRAVLVGLLMFASTLPMLSIILFALEIFSLLGQAPRVAVVPRLVRRENIVTANSLMLGAAYGTVPVGAGFNFVLALFPALMLGGLIPSSTQPYALAFVVDAATFVLSAALVASLPAIRADGVDVDEPAHVKATLQSIRDGLIYLWGDRSIRRVVLGMTTALFGGGSVIVIGKPFVEDVLGADETGFFAIVTSLGLGAAVGIAIVSTYSDRWLRRDSVFAVSVAAAGLGLLVASFSVTVTGAAAWILVMGLGAGAAYVMGLTHLHEQVEDEMRGRVFATLFGMMRVGLFVSMGVAVPLAASFSLVGFGILDDPNRMVLFVGGSVVLAAGLGLLWSLRSLIVKPRLDEVARDVIQAANRARHPSGRMTGSSDMQRESQVGSDDERGDVG